MPHRIRKYIEDYPDKKSFFGIIGIIFPEYSPEYKLIKDAYYAAKAAFKDDYREEGVRYFEHLRAVALILLLYLRVKDANIIASALLHDILEDKREEWTQERLAKEFNPEIATLVFWVSKETPEVFGGEKEKRDRAYHQKLNAAPREAILIKLADRLHNVITLWAKSKDDQMRKIRETQDFYLPLAEKHIVLIHLLESAIDEARSHIKG